jgi:flagellar biosynthesis/type III secretory pathway M-ring protein FliF/YscJ
LIWENNAMITILVSVIILLTAMIVVFIGAIYLVARWNRRTVQHLQRTPDKIKDLPDE